MYAQVIFLAFTSLCKEVHENFYFEVEEGGVEKLVAYLTPMDYFGEVALLSGETRNASIIAEGHCLTLSLERKHFTELFGSDKMAVTFGVSLFFITLKITLKNGFSSQFSKWYNFKTMGREKMIVYENFENNVTFSEKQLSKELNIVDR